MIDTTLLNAEERLLLCCRKSVMVPYVMSPVHNRNRQYPKAANCTSVPIIVIRIFVLIENRLYFKLISRNFPCHQRIFLL